MKTSQTWSLFGLCLVVVLAAMIWLTWKAFELERAEATAVAQAELEVELGIALWQIDSKLAPLLAMESARPLNAYAPVQTVQTAAGESIKVASPLMRKNEEHVMLHFRCSTDSAWCSPQVPEGEDTALAIENGLTVEDLSCNSTRLAELSSNLKREQLWEVLPEATPLPKLRMPVQDTTPIDSVTYQQATEAQLPNTAGVNFNRDDLPGQSYGNNAGGALDAGSTASANRDSGKFSFNYGAKRTREESKQRGNSRLRSRANALQSLSDYAAPMQQQGQIAAFSMLPTDQLTPKVVEIAEGMSQPIWVDDKLILARRVEIDGEQLVQGVWLNWPKVKQVALAAVTNYIGDLDLVPVTDNSVASIDATHLLASIPAQVVVPDVEINIALLTPIRTSLLIAWSCVLVGVAAIAGLLWGAIRLSDRRGAFVSAVTHELRTPLTTFRMYAEMLADDMVPDKAQQRSYLETLRNESDRLTHLVENVLSFARLERGRSNQTSEVVVQTLIDRAARRLLDRATQADMDLRFEIADEVANKTVRTNESVVEQILFNLVDNACKYAASAKDRRIVLSAAACGDSLLLCVRDFGPGIKSSQHKRRFQPFSKTVEEAAVTAPGIGLGLALCHRLAKDLGGSLEFEACEQPGAYCCVRIPWGK